MIRFILILYILSTTACSSDGTSPTTKEPEIETEILNPVSITKTNNTKIYMHYMPWFETNESSTNNQWGYHWTMQNKNPNNIDSNGKREIASHYYPLIGPYHSGDKDVIENHLLLMKYAGIDGILIDWYGTYNLNDYGIIKENTEQLIDVLDKVGLEYAIVYEDRFLNNIVDAELAPTAISAAKTDLAFLENNYFKDSNYIKINSKPLLLNFGPITLLEPENWADSFSALNTSPTFLTLWHQSNMAGENASGEYTWVYQNDTHLSDFYANNLPNLDVVMGSAYPGFKDFYEEGGVGNIIGWTIEHNNGTTLEQTLTLAKEANLEYLQLITWNDFGEGTMFEPTQEFGYSYIEKIKSFSGVQNTGNRFSNISDLYNLRKEFSANSEVQKKLDQAFYYFASLKPNEAITILEELK